MATVYENFIDFRLLGIDQNAESNDIILRFSKRFDTLNIYLDAVEDVLILDFRKCNVVENIVVYEDVTGKDVLEEKLTELAYGRSLAAAKKYPTFVEGLSRIVRNIETKKSKLLEVVPICGASVLALAGEVRFEQFSVQTS